MLAALLSLSAHAAAWSAVDVAAMPVVSPAGDAVAFVRADGSLAVVEATSGTLRYSVPPPAGGGRWQEVQGGLDGVLLVGITSSDQAVQGFVTWTDARLRWQETLPPDITRVLGAEGGLWELQRGGQQQRLLRLEDGQPRSPWLAGREIHEWSDEPGEPHSTYFEPSLQVFGQLAGHSLVVHASPRDPPRLEVWPSTSAAVPVWSLPVGAYPAARRLSEAVLRVGDRLLALDPRTARLLWEQTLPTDDCTQPFVGVRPLPEGRILVDRCALLEVRDARGWVVWSAPLRSTAPVVFTEAPGTAIRADAQQVAVFSASGDLQETLRLPSAVGDRWWMGSGVLMSDLDSGVGLSPVQGEVAWQRADVIGATLRGGWVEGRQESSRALVLLDPRTGETLRQWEDAVGVGAGADGAAMVYRYTAQRLEAVPPPAR